jgi:predicted RNase H-like HicB family nuclease
MRIKAVIHKSEDGGYWAEVPALPGCVTQAKTIEELSVMLREAVEGWIDAMSIPENEIDKESKLVEFNL